MEIKVSDARWAMDDKGVWLQLLVDKIDNVRVRQFAGSFDGAHTVKLKPFKKKRSLDANAYFWVLADKLSEKLGIPPADIYRSLIPNVGGNKEIICVREEAADKLIEGWTHNGIGWVCETMPSKIQGCVNVILYYGSSTYDTAQMSRLLELAIQECKQQGIETKPPWEIDSILEEWGCTK